MAEQHGGRIVVIGAGPTGLGAGYRLKELGHEDFHIYESAGHLGGLAASFTDDAGFTWDIGGHVMFSHYAYFDALFDRLMGDEFTLNERESWVRMMGRWVPYPFQNNVRYLPPEAAFECLSGLIKAQMGDGPKHTDATNFGQFIDAVFGEGIARHFMRPYNFKVWAHEPEMLNKTWIGERVAVLDVDRALRNVVMGLDDFGWGPNNMFKFPLKGGTGELYRRFGPILDGHVSLNTPVVGVDLDTKTITLADGSTDHYDELVSTMPVDLLLGKVATGDIPDEIRASALRLRHSGGHMVGVGIKRPCPSTKCWMYFPDDDCPFYRVTYLSNYSPNMTPDGDTHYSLLCETSESEFKPVDAGSIVEETIKGLENAGLLEPGERDDIVSVWHHHAGYSYPTPTVDRDEILDRVIPWLESRGVHSRGRFGIWKYEVSNTDHSVMQGVELVNRLLLDEPETTIGITYAATEDGREAADHDRPTVVASTNAGDVDEAELAEEELGVTSRGGE